MEPSEYRYFKFRPVNKFLIESIVNPSWYFSAPAALNDPFDCNINLRSAFAGAAKVASGHRRQFLESAIASGDLLDNFGSSVETAGVCSFSLGCNQTLLWSHYAEHHRGVCILYRFPGDFINDPSNGFLGLDTVKYGRRALKETLSTSPMEMKSFMNTLLQVYLTTKDGSWRPEREARILRPEPGVFQIPADFIEQVCFGLRTTDADLNLVRKLVEAHTPCRQFCRMVKDEREFGFAMKRI
jgi:hypothetical protein